MTNLAIKLSACRISLPSPGHLEAIRAESMKTALNILHGLKAEHFFFISEYSRISQQVEKECIKCELMSEGKNTKRSKDIL